MTSISALIDFLMSLMGDDKTKRAFTENPHGTMADNGLHNVSAQDVRDARLIMADSGSARPRNEGEHQSRGYHDGGLSSNDPVREIVHTTNTFEIDQSRHTDVNQNIFNIDNHRTTILDSFNSADTVTAIQDNDTTVDVDLDDDEEEDKDTTDTDKDTDEDADDKTDETDDERLAADRDDDGGGAPDDRDTDQDHAPEALDPEKPASEEPSEAEEPPADDADPGLDPGDGTDPFPTEPELEPVQDDAPVIFHADDELAVG